MIRLAFWLIAWNEVVGIPKITKQVFEKDKRRIMGKGFENRTYFCIIGLGCCAVTTTIPSYSLVVWRGPVLLSQGLKAMGEVWPTACLSKVSLGDSLTRLFLPYL